MKTPSLSRLFMLLGILIVIGLACGGSAGDASPTDRPSDDGGESTIAPADDATAKPTEEEIEQPTDEPSSDAPQYFVEETFADLSNWSYFLMNGEEDEMTISHDDGVLKFDLQGKNIWVYLMYDPFTYKDVRIDSRVENRGKNNNNVSLICRYSDEGWYEFNVANNGMWWIYAFLTEDNQYHEVYTGGSKQIKSGKEVNEYSAICEGYTLTLIINGKVVKEVEDKNYRLREGQIGVSVSSFDTLPIILEWNMIAVSQP